MHVLILSQIFPPDMGGSATRAYNVAKGLTLNGVKVTVIAGFPHYPTGNVPKDLRKRALAVSFMDGFRVIRTYVPPLSARGLANRMVLFMSFIISSLFPFLLVRKLNIVFASNPQVLAFFPALIYKIFHRCPLVLNVDDLWPEDPADVGMMRSSFMKKFGSLLANIAYKLADAITPISPGYIKVICGKYGVSSRKVYVVRGGVDTTKFKLNMSPKCNSGFTVLYSGAFSVAYDFDQVIKAAKLLEPYGDVEFVLQGGGELLGYVKRRVAEMHLKNVKIIDRILSRDEVAKLLGQADALLLPLRDFGRAYLGISSKLYEYQAAGKPIICIAKGQPAKYVEETNSGIVVKPGDCKALAEAIIFLKKNKHTAEKLSVSGRQYVENHLSIEKIGQQMIGVFKGLVRNK
ncbi:MAG: glycosyltransferase family 4 protein [Candidatus Bathyarchaeia archaeon]